MRVELEGRGIPVSIVAINSSSTASSQSSLVARGRFDMLQDDASVNAWGLLGGTKDDFFIYLAGGNLAPGGYLRYGGPVDTNLSTQAGYRSLLDRIVAAHELGAGPGCNAPPGGMQLQGNLNQDSALDISDAVLLLGKLFLGVENPLPCEGGTLESPGNIALLDVNGDANVDIGDPVHILNFLFSGGGPPSAGPGCTPVPGCPDACST